MANQPGYKYIRHLSRDFTPADCGDTVHHPRVLIDALRGESLLKIKTMAEGSARRQAYGMLTIL